MWFYVTCDQEGLPDFVACKPLKKTSSWAHPLSQAEKATLNPLITRIADLLKTLGQEEGGIHLIATFVRRQVQPLRVRPHPLWVDEGPSDPSRMSLTELSDEEVV